MGHRVPDFEKTSFAVEITGDTGSFAIGNTATISKIYPVGASSVQDSLSNCGISLNLSFALVGGTVDNDITISLSGSLDGTTVSTILPGGTFMPNLTITDISNAGGTYVTTRTYGIEDGLGAYVQFVFQRTAGDGTLTCTANARRWRWLEL